MLRRSFSQPSLADAFTHGRRIAVAGGLDIGQRDDLTQPFPSLILGPNVQKTPTIEPFNN
jgi:hypothetical protein